MGIPFNQSAFNPTTVFKVIENDSNIMISSWKRNPKPQLR